MAAVDHNWLMRCRHRNLIQCESHEQVCRWVQKDYEYATGKQTTGVIVVSVSEIIQVRE